MRLRTTMASALVALLAAGMGCGDDDPAGPGDTDQNNVTRFAHLVAGAGGDVAYDVTVASNGDRVVVGGFTESAGFKLPPLRPAGPMADSLNANGEADIFVVGYRPDGTRAWERNFGGATSDIAIAATADGSGNVYVAAAFSGTVQMGTTQLISNGDFDVMVTKLGPDHEPIWSFGAGGSGYDQPWRITRDGGGNLLVTGTFSGTVNFGGTMLTADGSGDGFLLKLSDTGGVVWAKRIGGAGFADRTFGVDVDASDNIYVAGAYTDSTDFGGVKLGTPNGPEDAFLARYNAAGALQWVRSGNGDEQVQGWGLAVLGDRVCVTGNFEDTANFSTSAITSAGEFDVFAACYALDGTLLWLRRFGGSGSDEATSLVPAGGNDVWMTGGFQQVASFGSTPLTTNGDYDIFLLRLDASGVPTVVEGYGGTFADAGISLATADGRPIVCGYLEGAVSLGGIDVTGSGMRDGYIFQR